MTNVKYSFEELGIWQKSVDFAKEVIDLTDKIEADRKHYRLIEQLEAAASSIAMNIAEGKGRYSKKEFIKFLYVARGSLFETITLLTIFHRKAWIDDDQIAKSRAAGDEIGKMLSGLINSIKVSL